jgi:TonB family protein
VRICIRIRALLLASCVAHLCASALAIAANPPRFVIASGSHISRIYGASGEPHQMVSVKQSAEFVDQDFPTLTLDERPCIFVATTATPGDRIPPNAAYAVFAECFDLIAAHERKSLLYLADDNGRPIDIGRTFPLNEFEPTEPGFDQPVWEWVSAHVSKRLAQRIQDEQQAHSATAPDPLESVPPMPHGTTPPKLIHAVDAHFSDAGLQHSINGICVLAMVIDIDGTPKRIQVIRPLGYGMDEEAIRAVTQYRFKPAMLDGKDVPVKISIEVAFHLKR